MRRISLGMIEVILALVLGSLVLVKTTWEAVLELCLSIVNSLLSTIKVRLTGFDNVCPIAVANLAATRVDHP